MSSPIHDIVVSPASTGPVGLERSGTYWIGGLPNDIWRLIVRVMDICDVKKLRCVSKELSHIGIDVLFRKITLLESYTSLLRLLELIKCPSTAESVSRTTKVLQLFTIHSTHPFSYGILPRSVANAVEEFFKIKNESDDLGVLILSLSHFKNLTTVVVRSVFHMSRDGYIPSKREGRLALVISQYQNPRYYTCRGFACIALGIAKHKLSPCNLQVEMGIAMLLDYRVISAIKYTFQQARNLDIDVSLVDNEPPWEEFRIRDRGDDDTIEGCEVKRVVEEGLLGQCFATAAKLEHLRVSFVCFNYPWVSRPLASFVEMHSWSLETYLGTQAWPRLRSLTLAKLIVDAESLLQVLERNGNTLRKVLLRYPLFKEDQWPMFFRTLRDYHDQAKMHLETINIVGDMQWTSPGTDIDSINPFESEQPCKCSTSRPMILKEDHHDYEYMEEMKSQYGLDDVVLKHAMEKYVLKGFPWVWHLYPTVLEPYQAYFDLHDFNEDF